MMTCPITNAIITGHGVWVNLRTCINLLTHIHLMICLNGCSVNNAIMFEGGIHKKQDNEMGGKRTTISALFLPSGTRHPHL